ncbi:hypothetical protein BV22DRAFT_355157 [Leucogyrophana mollusca]|uniref:Uncharacterized protein n=1 Tax=Leucogyrophana mollusca TaxID=85980 RepID=A0ACB8BMX6_9AGAM|nr:hypothetical protein BV22DRAFT_355157 [Leucogyrophana mollusca]
MHHIYCCLLPTFCTAKRTCQRVVGAAAFAPPVNTLCSPYQGAKGEDVGELPTHAFSRQGFPNAFRGALTHRPLPLLGSISLARGQCWRI